MSVVDVGDEQVLQSYPQVRLDHRNKAFYRALLGHELVAAHCRDCGTWHTPIRSVCPECWSAEVAVTPVAGHGRIHLLIRLYQGPSTGDVSYATPWPLAAVEMAEQPGLRFVSTVVECPPELLRVGLPVELTWIERDGAPWFAFRPAGLPEASGEG
jgi:uncharacterized OB-fold protein